MKVRIFKTYKFTDKLDYISFNFLPTIVYEGFHEGNKCLFIGWSIWGLQIKW